MDTDTGVTESAAQYLECGDVSPLSLPERLVAQAEPRRAARRTDPASPQL